LPKDLKHQYHFIINDMRLEMLSNEGKFYIRSVREKIDKPEYVLSVEDSLNYANNKAVLTSGNENEELAEK
ncbi:MAG: hypothetical protein ACRCXT_01620, partial [Paraclostridium sp.]